MPEVRTKHYRSHDHVRLYAVEFFINDFGGPIHGFRKQDGLRHERRVLIRGAESNAMIFKNVLYFFLESKSKFKMGLLIFPRDKIIEP